MKKITILMLAFLAVSCIEKNDVRPGSPLDVDIDHYQTARTYDVPVKEGCITDPFGRGADDDVRPAR